MSGAWQTVASVEIVHLVCFPFFPCFIFFSPTLAALGLHSQIKQCKENLTFLSIALLSLTPILTLWPPNVWAFPTTC